MNKPFISIITCTRNSEKYLKKCLDSVTSQTSSDYEHIIIDGKSSDGTQALITEYKGRHPHVRVYESVAKGIGNAMNMGISYAQGEYLYFLHSDDYLRDPHVIAHVIDYIQANNAPDWVYGQVRVVDGDDRGIGIFPRFKIFQQPSPLLLKFYNYIPHQAAFVKKAIFDKYGVFDEHLKTVMDYDLWLRLARQTTWCYMPVCVAGYRIHKDAQSSSSSRLSENISEQLLMRKKYLSPIEFTIARIVSSILSKVNKTTR